MDDIDRIRNYLKNLIDFLDDEDVLNIYNTFYVIKDIFEKHTCEYGHVHIPNVETMECLTEDKSKYKSYNPDDYGGLDKFFESICKDEDIDET